MSSNIVTNVSTELAKRFGRTGLILQKYSPEILLGVGLVGAIGAAVLACKATLKAEDIIGETKGDLKLIHEIKETKNEGVYSQTDYQKDLALAYFKAGTKFAKLYGPAVGLGALSVASILASHGIMTRRNVALMAAYNVVAEGFAAYRERVVNDLGVDADKKYRFGIEEEEIETEEEGKDGQKVKIKKKVGVAKQVMVSDYAKFFDESCEEWRSDPMHNLYFLTSTQNYFNDMLKIRGHVFLNEIYDRLGIPRTKAGAVVGWIKDNPDGDGFIDFNIYNTYNTPNRDFVNGYNKAILLDFNVDGVIYNLI